MKLNLSVVKGLLTFIPGVRDLLPLAATGGTNSALYCYGVWLKHLTYLWESGLRTIPNTLAELGPGDSLGIGLASMLCGVNNYYALDIVEYSNTDTNLKILDELIDLFQSRAARPIKGWPDFDAYLDQQLFPSHILSDTLLANAISPNRIAAIRHAIKNPLSQNSEVSIKYVVPWFDKRIIENENVDVIISHSVLEHVDDMEGTYQAFASWLKPNGIMSHQIDFESHGISTAWNGYRAHSELFWKMLSGKRPYLINRQPYSAHRALLEKYSFTVVCDLKKHRADGILRSALSKHWENITEDDLTCSGAFIQSIKKIGHS